jgi:hypothetical protein
MPLYQEVFIVKFMPHACGASVARKTTKSSTGLPKPKAADGDQGILVE